MTEHVGGEGLDRLARFVRDFAALLDGAPPEAEILARGGALLGDLVRHDDWLPAAWAAPDPRHHQQYLLHCDSAERFCVVSFVWAGGQAIPVHNHGVWGLVGMLRGREASQSYRIENDIPVPCGPEVVLTPGDVEPVSPMIGDIHSVRNALADRSAISIHVYGGNIGTIRRSIYHPDGAVTPFISGYSNDILPNIWKMTQ